MSASVAHLTFEALSGPVPVVIDKSVTWPSELAICGGVLTIWRKVKSALDVHVRLFSTSARNSMKQEEWKTYAETAPATKVAAKVVASSTTGHLPVALAAPVRATADVYTWVLSAFA